MIDSGSALRSERVVHGHLFHQEWVMFLFKHHTMFTLAVGSEGGWGWGWGGWILLEVTFMCRMLKNMAFQLV